jgi:pimeloyl-ACP methyl ester carboxylesterase
LAGQVTFQIGCGHLNAVTAGPERGPAVLLLHGFPEFSRGWRKQIGPLAEAGFRVIAPDQRGYNQSSKPAAVQAYRMPELTADVIAIADQLGRERILLAGHDWGAAVAWNTAIQHPGRIEKLAILNVPHPAVMLRFLKTQPRQMLRSWYILFFQIPRLPELLFSARNFEGGVRALLNSSRPDTFTAADLEQYRRAWSEPGAVSAMINWYRALFRYLPEAAVVESRVTVPTRILWGERDRFLLREMAAASLQYCDRGELFTFPEATHWLQHEEPRRVTELLIDFFRSAA